MIASKTVTSAWESEIWNSKATAFLLLMTLLLCAICVLPQQAFAAYTIYMTDVNGNPIADGNVTMDINLLQQGVIVYVTSNDTSDISTGIRVDFVDDETGDYVKVGSEGGFTDPSSYRDHWGHVYPTEALKPGHHYTFTYWLIRHPDYAKIEQHTVHVTTSGDGSGGTAVGGGDDAGAGTGTGTDTGGSGTSTDGADTGTGSTNTGTGTAGTDQNAETDASQKQAADSSPQDTTASQQKTLSTSASSSDGTPSAQASQQAVATASNSDEASSADSDELSGTGLDPSTLSAGASSAAGSLSGKALAALGNVYSVAGDPKGSDGDTATDTTSAVSLSITGLPYLWVALCILFACTLPFGVTRRYAGFRHALAGHTRLHQAG